MDFSKTKSGTAAVWAGEVKPFAEGATTPPVFNSVTFAYDNIDDWFDSAVGKKEGHIYSRNTNPTVAVFEEKMRVLEHAEAATSFATGMAAVSNTLFTLLSPGDRVVSIKDSYGGTSKIFMDHLPRFNVDVMLCETTDHEQLESEVQKGCKVLYLESPTNPTLKILDLHRLIQCAKEAGTVTIVDNTFATPINQNPILLDADLVLHSATKFLGGHSDAMGGIICGRKELVEEVFRYREINGASLSAAAAYYLIRGIKTLELRILRQNENALKIAQFLSKHPKIDEVYYPGLESHPAHTIARQQMTGFGGVLGFSLKGGFDEVKAFLTNLQFAHRAASLGSVSTLVGPPKTTSHVEMTEAQRKKLGIPETLVRYSTGIENAEDLLNDLDNALAMI